MERREAPGRCATAPLHAPCDRGVYAPTERVCETRPEARASRSGELARPRHPDAAPPGAPPAGAVARVRPRAPGLISGPASRPARLPAAS